MFIARSLRDHHCPWRALISSEPSVEVVWKIQQRLCCCCCQVAVVQGQTAHLPNNCSEVSRRDCSTHPHAWRTMLTSDQAWIHSRYASLILHNMLWNPSRLWSAAPSHYLSGAKSPQQPALCQTPPMPAAGEALTIGA